MTASIKLIYKKLKRTLKCNQTQYVKFKFKIFIILRDFEFISLMSQAIEARQVNSEGPQLSSSNISKKDEIQPPIEQQHLLRLTSGLNRFNSVDFQSLTNQNVVLAPQTRRFEHQSSERPLNINEQSKYMQRNYTQVSPIGLNTKIGTEISPIRKFQNEDHHEAQDNKLQKEEFSWHNNFQSPYQNRPTRNEQNLSSNSVGYDFSRNASSYFDKGLARPQTHVIEGGQTDRSTYFSGDEYKKYRVGSEQQTKLHTYREGDNVTGLSSLNSSYKKVSNFSSPNDQPFTRPYSTLNLPNRPQSFNPTDWNRPISYQEQNIRLNNYLHQNHSDNLGGMTNLTALESQGVIEEDPKYMRTFVERPVTGYQDDMRWTDSYRPRTNLYQRGERNHYEAKSWLGNHQETNINRLGRGEPHELIFSNITEIKRPHYENKYVQKREIRKLGGSEQTKIIFKNNWILLAFLLLLLLGLISLGVLFGRNSYLQRHKYESGYAEITEKQPGVKPTLVNPTQIKHVNTTESTNQTGTNGSIPPKPIQYPPISINITIVNPQIQTRNDTIIKPQPNKTLLNISLLPQQVPIVFPPVEVGVQNAANGSMVANVTEKPVEKPNITEPVLVPEGNVTANVSGNVTVVKPTNFTQTPVSPVVNLTQTNLTVPNASIPIEPVIIPAQPTQPANKPIQIPIEPVTIPTQPITPIVAPPNITQSITTANEYKPKIDYRPTAEYIQPQQVKDLNEYQGYEASGYYYFPIVQKEDYFIEPMKSNQVYPQVVPSESAMVQPLKSQVVAPISIPGAGDIYVLPETQMQFDETYEASIVDTTSDMPIEPTATPQNITKVDTNITAIIEPKIQLSTISTVNETTITPITKPQPIIETSIEPVIIQSTLNPSIPVQPKPTPQQLPSYMSQYLQPQKVSEFQVSIQPMKEQVDFQKAVNASVPSGTISIEPVNGYITQPENTEDFYLPSTVVITPTPIQTGNEIRPIATKIDLGTANFTIEPSETTTITPSQTIIPQASYIAPENITDLEISIPPNVKPITVKPQSQSFILPTQIQTIEPTKTQSQTFVTPQSVNPAQVKPSFVQPVITNPTGTQVGDNSFNASKDQTFTIMPEIVDNYSVEPQKTIDQGTIKPNKTQDIEITPIPYLKYKNDSISFQVTPIEVIPQTTQPQIIIPIIPTASQTVPPQTLSIQIQLQQPTPPQQITTIPITSNQSTTQFLSSQPTEIAATQTSTIQPAQTTWISPSTPEIPSFVEPSITQLPIKHPTIINQIQQFAPIAQPLSSQAKTTIISQTNFTDPNEFIINQVKRLTSILQTEPIYEIPQGYDKAKLAQIQKNFLAFYNKTLQQKSLFEIIPLFWKATKDSTLLTENQYPIYYTQNGTENSGSVNYLPQILPTNWKTSTQPQVKETIVEISPTGELIVLQKGSDWPQITKNMETYQSSGIPASVFPNILKQQKVKHRHSLRRDD